MEYYMKRYGYILDIETFELQECDYISTIRRVEEDGIETEYHCIETSRIIEDDGNVTMVGNAEEFRAWRDQHGYIGMDGEVQIKQKSTDYFTIEGSRFITIVLLHNIKYNQRVSRSLNTSVDVYFDYTHGGETKTAGVRFSDWNVFRTLTDEQCLAKIKEYILKNDSIRHPAKSLPL